jgi:hypothetical protein
VAFCAFGTLERGPIMTPVVAAKKLSKFDPTTFLSTLDGGRKIAALAKKQIIFAQGDSSDAVFYIQKGKVKLTVVSKTGKEATLLYPHSSKAILPDASSYPNYRGPGEPHDTRSQIVIRDHPHHSSHDSVRRVFPFDLTDR